MEIAVSKAYLTVLVNRYRLKSFTANVERLKKLLNDTKAYASQGFVEEIDAKRLEVQFNNLLTEQIKVQNLMKLSEELLKFQMGFPLTDSLGLKDSLPMFESESSIGTNLTIEQRPDLLALAAQKRLQELDIRRLHLGYLPSIAAYGALQTNAQRNDFTLFDFDKNDITKQWYTISLVGLSINVPVFDGFQRHQKINQAKLNLQKVNNAQYLLEQAARLELKTAFVQYETPCSLTIHQAYTTHSNILLRVHV